MLYLLKRYKGKLLGIIMVVIAISLMFGTMSYIMSYQPNASYVDCLMTSLYYTSIIVLSMIILFIGTDYVNGNDESKKLTKDFKTAFKRK